MLEKPTGEQSDRQWEADVPADHQAGLADQGDHPSAGPAGRQGEPRSEPDALPAPAEPGPYRCVAIGASTGGPGAVVRILQGLPADFPLPILLVIHIGAPFGVAMAEWLDTLLADPGGHRRTASRCRRSGQPQVILAPPDRHLVVRGNRLWTTADPERHFCRPSVDVLFESLARELGDAAIACLLTGMGRDGAQGLLAIRRAGGMTLAQDEESCVVFGMPREAIQLKAACSVLPLEEMAPSLLELARPAGVTGGRSS